MMPNLFDKKTEKEEFEESEIKLLNVFRWGLGHRKLIKEFEEEAEEYLNEMDKLI